MQYCVVFWLLFSSAVTYPTEELRVDLPVFWTDVDPDPTDAEVVASNTVKLAEPGSYSAVEAIDVNKNTDAEVVASNTVRLAEPLETENPPGEDRRDRTLVKSVLAHKVQAASDVIKSRLLQSPLSHSAHQEIPFWKTDTAVLESEGLGSKKLSVKDYLHQIAANNLHPTPLVDIITEEEKYGNDGGKFSAVGKAIVGGAEKVSNFVNSALEVPAALFRSFTRAATEKLNALGGKLIGL